jgi:hypothetical protein
MSESPERLESIHIDSRDSDERYGNIMTGCALWAFACFVVAGIGMVAVGISQERALGRDPGGPGNLPGAGLFLGLGGMLLLAVAWFLSVFLTAAFIIRAITTNRGWSWWGIVVAVYLVFGVTVILVYRP